MKHLRKQGVSWVWQSEHVFLYRRKRVNRNLPCKCVYFEDNDETNSTNRFASAEPSFRKTFHTASAVGWSVCLVFSLQPLSFTQLQNPVLPSFTGDGRHLWGGCCRWPCPSLSSGDQLTSITGKSLSRTATCRERNQIPLCWSTTVLRQNQTQIFL